MNGNNGQEQIINEIEINTNSNNLNNSGNLQINENNNPNPNINNNQNQNNNVQNNNVLPTVKLHMIQVSNPNNEGRERIVDGDSIETNNSIAIWYALKTTMYYLLYRGAMTDKKLRTKLDLAAKNNLKSISNYLEKLGIEKKDIDGLASAFGDIEEQDVDGKRVQSVEVNGSRISEMLNKYQEGNKSIEDLVFDRLKETTVDIENNNVLLVKHNFDKLKNTIKTGAETRNQKVFLSRAATEFQKKVKELEPVKEDNKRDEKRKNYNEAVKNLDSAIFEAMKGKLHRYRYEGQDNQVDKREIQEKLDNGTLFGSFGFKREQQQGQPPVQQPVQPEGKPEYIEVKADTEYFKPILEQIRNTLISANNGLRVELAQDLEGENSKIRDALSEWNNCFNQLDGNDKNAARRNSWQLEQNQQPGDLNNDLKGISNDKDIKEITLEFDEYNNFVSHKLSGDANDINGTMQKFIKTVLLENPKDDECKKAKGNLKGMVSHVNEVLNQVKTNHDYVKFKYKGQYLKAILRLDQEQNPKDVEFKNQKFFVPTFINQLFEINSGNNLENLANNLEMLSKDQDFTTFLSNIMEDDFAVDMIKNNFKEIEKGFKDAGYKATRRGKFKEEFWDNNLKGHLPFVGKWSDGQWKKNFAMLSGESLGGFALGSAFAAKLGLSLAGGILPAIGAAAVILVTAIAIAVLVSLMMALFKGFMDVKEGKGFYKPTKKDQEAANTEQIAYLNRIYTAFLTFGADAEKLKNLVAESKQQNFDKKSPKGKFFKSMVDMKKFLEENANKYDETKGLVGKDTPFQKLKNILEGKNQEPPQNQNNQNNEEIHV